MSKASYLRRVEEAQTRVDQARAEGRLPPSPSSVNVEGATGYGGSGGGLALVLGLVLWILAALVCWLTPPWFVGLEIVGACAPIIALVGTGIAYDARGGSPALVVWSVAFAPLLLVVGSFSHHMLQSMIFGNVYSRFAELCSPFLAVVAWIALGAATYYLFPPQQNADRP